MRTVTQWFFVMLAVVGLFVLWGVVIEPRFILDEEEIVADIPNLPSSWQGQTLAVIADLQIGMWLANEGMVEKAIKQVVQHDPAALLIAGDFLYAPTDDDVDEARSEVRKGEQLAEVKQQIIDVVELLNPVIQSNIPVYAVLGNHDYAYGKESAWPIEEVADRLVQALEASGVQVLRNEVAELKPRQIESRSPAQVDESSVLYLGGIGPALPNQVQVQPVLNRIPQGQPRLFLLHNPRTFEQFPPGSAPMAIGGHFHGGQIRVPGFPEWSWLSLFRKKGVFADGWVDGLGKEGNRIYVNRGIGFSRWPIRINCPPEVTYIELRGAEESVADSKQASWNGLITQ